MDIEAIIISFSYLGIFGLMITNGLMTLPSSQVLYIICGYFIFTGDLVLPLVILTGAFGNTVGNILLYEATRKKGLEYVTKYKIFPEKEVRKVTIALNKKGSWFLFVGKLLPAIKVFVPVAAGMAKTKRSLYIPLMLIASIIWTIPFISIGYYFGKSSDLFGKYAIGLMIVAIIVMFAFYKYMNSSEVLEELEESKKTTTTSKKNSDKFVKIRYKRKNIKN